MIRPHAAAACMLGLIGCWSPGEPVIAPEPPTQATDGTSAALEALGYLDGYEAPSSDATGVTVHDKARAWSGVNLVVSGHAATAELVDMDGASLHRWALPLESAFPQVTGKRPTPEEKGRRWVDWRRVSLRPDGGLIAIHEGLGLLSIDRDSKLKWAVENHAHHDLTDTPDGKLLVLTRTLQEVSWLRAKPVLDDHVDTVDPATGATLASVSMLEALRDTPWADLLKHVPPGVDVLHTNTITLLDGTGAEAWPLLAKGRWLVSFRNIDTVAIVDPTTAKVVWAQRGPWRGQHDPKPLPNGMLVLFDNVGLAPDHSRVVRWDGVNGKLDWSWDGGGAAFSSRLCGAVQPLPNGNLLVTESDSGRAVELAPDGSIVWEYRNPARAERSPTLVATLLEVDRLPADAWTPTRTD